MCRAEVKWIKNRDMALAKLSDDPIKRALDTLSSQIHNFTEVRLNSMQPLKVAKEFRSRKAVIPSKRRAYHLLSRYLF